MSPSASALREALPSLSATVSPPFWEKLHTSRPLTSGVRHGTLYSLSGADGARKKTGVFRAVLLFVFFRAASASRQAAFLREVFHRVERRSFCVAQLEVQVVAGGAARTAYGGYFVALFDALAYFDVVRRVVRVERPEAAPWLITMTRP